MTALSKTPTPNGTYYSFTYYPRPSQRFYISFSQEINDRMFVTIYCGGQVMRRFSVRRDRFQCLSLWRHYRMRNHPVMTFAELKTYTKDMIKRELVAKKET